MERLKALLADERRNFALWTPVMLGFGVQLYFWAPSEPPGWAYSLALAAPVLVFAAGWRRLRHYAVVGFVLLVVAIGFSLVGARARLVEAPVIAGPLDATVEGVVRQVERTRSGRPRLVMDDLVIFGISARETPERVQVALLKDADLGDLGPGDRVSIFAHLGPPGAPVEPGGFDFRRAAWFEGLGAVGYARGAPVAIGEDGASGLFRRASLALATERARISAWFRARLDGETGAFAAAITVGDRAGISRDSLQALRDSNLAHLLAISGLHMGLVTALIFAAARLALAAVPFTARRWRTKRVAAAVALIAATGFLFISGGSIATQRAYLMALVALVAVMLNRPAITLRTLAVAALAILIVRPESLTHVGFQMSFAATAAIIAGFEFARERGWTAPLTEGGWRSKLIGYVVFLAATSLLAGLATAPFAAFHFNRVTSYGLIANVAAVPIMGFWVAPTALLTAVLAPLGLEAWALAALGTGIDAIMAVARFVSGLESAARPVEAASATAFTLVVLGGLGLCLGRNLAKSLGALICIAGLIVWLGGSERPPVLVAPGAALLGVEGPAGRAIDHPRIQGYAARQWLEKDGDAANQEAAAARPGYIDTQAGSAVIFENGWRLETIISRRVNPAALAEACAPRTLLLVRNADISPDGPCIAIVGDALEAQGALAIWPTEDGLRIVTARARAGRRFWTMAVGEREDARLGKN